MRLRISLALIAVGVAGIGTLSSTEAKAANRAQIEALEAIKKAAAEICNTVTTEGSSQNVELSGQVKSQLEGVVSNVAGLGIEGAGKYNSSQFKNVLQQDLAKVLQHNTECKRDVFTILQAKMLSTKLDESPNISGFWRDVEYPSNGSQISQDGHRFTFKRWGALPNGDRFDVFGSGTVTGQSYNSNYDAAYRSGRTSTGSCSGTVSTDAMHIRGTCSDTLWGTFPLFAIRQ
jgi:hypothetical protein